MKHNGGHGSPPTRKHSRNLTVWDLFLTLLKRNAKSLFICRGDFGSLRKCFLFALSPSPTFFSPVQSGLTQKTLQQKSFGCVNMWWLSKHKLQQPFTSYESAINSWALLQNPLSAAVNFTFFPIIHFSNADLRGQSASFTPYPPCDVSMTVFWTNANSPWLHDRGLLIQTIDRPRKRLQVFAINYLIRVRHQKESKLLNDFIVYLRLQVFIFISFGF